MKETGEPIGISACLAGKHCRYDGKHSKDEELLKNLQGKRLILICPEELGGLPTPRPKAWLMGGDGFEVLLGKGFVVSEEGKDVTSNFISGAAKALAMLLAEDVKTVYVKEKSPSCGFNITTVDQNKINGKGVFSALALLSKLKVIGR